jgi:hypothetical protein
MLASRMPDPARLISLPRALRAASRRIARLGRTLVADASSHADLVSANIEVEGSLINYIVGRPLQRGLARHPLRLSLKHRQA